MPNAMTDAMIHDLINSIGTYELARAFWTHIGVQAAIDDMNGASFPYIAYMVSEWLKRNNLASPLVAVNYPKPPDFSESTNATG